MTPDVYVLTWCNNAENLYGTTLTFKTLRVGFPDARIHVIENASLKECRPLIREAAEKCEVEFTQLTVPMKHHEMIEGVINSHPDGTVIFVDPDVCFWKNIQGWQFDALIAGRYLPTFACELTRCVTHQRLHTSLWWIPNVRLLRSAIHSLLARYFEFEPIRPTMFLLNDFWQRFDTGAALFPALRAQMHVFTDDELDAYDHLFCGTHYTFAASLLHADYAARFKEMHEHAKGNHLAIKGAWRLQDEYFSYRSGLAP